MKILLVYNATSPRCGIRNTGEQWTTALRHAGCTVDVHDGTFPTDRWFPADVATYDHTLLIWNPQTINHYTGAPPESWPAREKCSVLIGEIPPYATCPFLDRFTHVWTVDPSEIATWTLMVPVPDWVTELPPADPIFTLGVSTIRGEGLELLEGLREAHPGWALNLPDGRWRSTDDEVRRLARSTVNLCWYASVRNERASAPALCVASRRPLIINTSPMLSHLQGLPGVGFAWSVKELDELLAWTARQHRRGDRIAEVEYPEAWRWSAVAQKAIEIWRAA